MDFLDDWVRNYFAPTKKVRPPIENQDGTVTFTFKMGNQIEYLVIAHQDDIAERNYLKERMHWFEVLGKHYLEEMQDWLAWSNKDWATGRLGTLTHSDEDSRQYQKLAMRKGQAATNCFAVARKFKLKLEMVGE